MRKSSKNIQLCPQTWLSDASINPSSLCSKPLRSVWPTMVLKRRHYLRHIPLAVLCCTMQFFLPHYRIFLCVHTLHPSACLNPLTYISSPAFVIFSSLVVKAPWMMSIIPFHIMWRHLFWQSYHCWGHCLMSLSKLTIDFIRTQVSVREKF